jgi:ankyrin repeat protein
MLLEAGASPDDGESAFHAAERHHVEALELLLEYGAPTDAVDENGVTALHNAAIRGDVDAVRELLARGADRRREDPQHHATPLGWPEFGRDEAIAPDGDYEACIRMLATAG